MVLWHSQRTESHSSPFVKPRANQISTMALLVRARATLHGRNTQDSQRSVRKSKLLVV